MRRRGQVVGFDLMIAVAIFMLISIFLVFTWVEYNHKIDQRVEYNDMIATGLQTTNILVKSPGYPWNWNTTDVEFIGLVDEDRQISQAKLDQFLNMSYADLRNKLKTGPYDFYFNLEKTDGENVTLGLTPSGERQFRLERYVKHGNEKAKLQLTLWK
jgi:hypothetical protein